LPDGSLEAGMCPAADATPLHRRRLLLLVAVAVLAALAGCGGAEPAPTVCHGCTGDDTAEALPPNATTGESVTHLYLDPGANDAPRVEARMAVDAETASSLRFNATRREALREAALDARAGGRSGSAAGASADRDGTTPTPRYEGTDGRRIYPVSAFEARDLSVTAADEAYVVDYRVAGIPDREPDGTPSLATEGVGGAVLVDRFDVRDGRNPHPENGGHTYRLATDRLVVHAPPGTRPVVAPENATVREDAVVLRSIPADTELVFAPPGATGTLAAQLSLTSDRLGWVVPDALRIAAIPTLQLGLLLGGLRGETSGGIRYPIAAVLLALLLTAGPLALLLGPLGVAGVGVTVLAALGLFWRAGRDEKAAGPAEPDAGTADDGHLPSRTRLRAVANAWAVPIAVAALVATVATVAAAATTGGPVVGLLFLVGGVLPVGALVGLGRLRTGTADRPRRRRALVLTVLVAPWLLAVGHVAGRGVPEPLEASLLVLAWGPAVTLGGFIAHRIATKLPVRPGRGTD
jgi:hypothetical protein